MASSTSPSTIRCRAGRPCPSLRRREICLGHERHQASGSPHRGQGGVVAQCHEVRPVHAGGEHPAAGKMQTVADVARFAQRRELAREQSVRVVPPTARVAASRRPECPTSDDSPAAPAPVTSPHRGGPAPATDAGCGRQPRPRSRRVHRCGGRPRSGRRAGCRLLLKAGSSLVFSTLSLEQLDRSRCPAASIRFARVPVAASPRGGSRNACLRRWVGGDHRRTSGAAGSGLVLAPRRAAAVKRTCRAASPWRLSITAT